MAFLNNVILVYIQEKETIKKTVFSWQFQLTKLLLLKIYQVIYMLELFKMCSSLHILYYFSYEYCKSIKKRNFILTFSCLKLFPLSYIFFETTHIQRKQIIVNHQIRLQIHTSLLIHNYRNHTEGSLMHKNTASTTWKICCLAPARFILIITISLKNQLIQFWVYKRYICGRLRTCFERSFTKQQLIISLRYSGNFVQIKQESFYVERMFSVISQ